MKLRSVFLATALVLLSVVSCTKESPVKNYTLEGLYIGFYTVDNIPSQGSLFYSIVLYPDGSAITKGKGGDNSDAYGAGTYKLTGGVLTATINSFIKTSTGVPVTQVLTFGYSSVKGALTDGTWKDTINPFGKPNTGKFSTLQRIN